jgi:hypothetical protein
MRLNQPEDSHLQTRRREEGTQTSRGSLQLSATMESADVTFTDFIITIMHQNN